ncbi:hypothetical protein J4714_14000 [Staphylococcus epidermidis]|nr:hypothetical protein [Staphylococcus epidermidis]
MATGSVYWGREWTKNEETATWNFDLQTGLLIIDTGIDVTEAWTLPSISRFMPS